MVVSLRLIQRLHKLVDINKFIYRTSNIKHIFNGDLNVVFKNKNTEHQS